MASANPVTLPVSAYTAEHVALHAERGIITITLNRPDRKNPLTFESYRELCNIFHALRLDDTAKAVVVIGAGGNFSSGGDGFEIIGPLVAMNTKELTAFTRMTGELVKAMRACPQPIVAAVDGICAGAGAILAMAADIRLATPRAKVAFLFNKVGLAGCDMGACAMLPRIIGHGRAAELLFTGRSMSADEAVASGFFNRLVSPEQVLKESLQLAAEIAAGPTFAHAMTKRMLHAEWNLSVDAAIDAEAEAQALCMQTEDFRRAYRAFASRQKPHFEGN